MENWKAVPGYEGLYEVSDRGLVRSLARVTVRQDRWGQPSQIRVPERVLKPSPFGKSGHVCVNLWKDGVGKCFLIHHLVLIAFVGPKPHGTECRHLDGVPSNNSLTNLVWGTRAENMADRTRLGEHNPARGEKRHNAVLTEDQVRAIRLLKSRGMGGSQISREMGVNINTVFSIISGRTWGWLE